MRRLPPLKLVAYRLYNNIIRKLARFANDEKSFRARYSYKMKYQANAKYRPSKEEERQTLTFLYVLNTINIGDQLSCPGKYFTFDAHPRYENVMEKFNLGQVSYPRLIIGGGDMAMLADSAYSSRLASEKAVFWGAGIGLNSKLPTDSFQLMGIRDYGHEGIDNNRVFYVPCASCMSPLFDLRYSVKQDVVFFLHAKFSPGDVVEYAHNSGYPVLTNYEPSAVKVIRALGSADTVVTNSYHGLYWSTLLGRKVIVPDSCDHRFHSFRYEPVYSSLDELAKNLKYAQTYPQALQECRDINKDFYARVCRLFYPE